MKIWKRILGLCIPFLLMTGCGGGGGSGQIKLSLTDSATDQYNAVYVTIDSIEVHASNMSDDSWVTLDNLTLPRTINLLDLMNGVREELGIASLSSGHFTQMRLIIGKTPDSGINILSQAHPFANYVIDINNVVHELKVPSGFQTGIKIVGGFDVNDNETTELILDFDASASVVVAGKSGQYILKPTIKILETTDFAIVSGTVTSGVAVVPGAMVSAQIFDPAAADPKDQVVIEAATVTDLNGNYKLFVRPGTYNFVVYKNGFSPVVQQLTLTAGMTFTANFDLTSTTTGTVTEQVSIAASDPNNPSFVTTSFRQTAPNSTDMIEIFSINIASGSSVLFTLDSGDYVVVNSTFGEATQVIPASPNLPLFNVGDGTNTDLIVNF
jgi:uncharacterized protein DUF4382/carboxypeptidase family protein